MPLHRVAGWRELIDPRGACLNLVDLLAVVTKEVMVMVRMLALVMRRRTGDLDHLHGTQVDQDAKRAVNSGDSQSGGIIPGRLPNLGWREGAGGII